MKNKKGFIRIIEVLFAILIIAGAVLILISNNLKNSDISEEVYEKQKYILNIISNNEQMRNEIINGNTDLTNKFIKDSIPKNWHFSICITEINNICDNSPSENKDIYVSETIISSSLTTYNTKKLRFFIWR
ncbi:MAG: type II secretion system protein [Nanoarchaeota archaeon]